MKSSDTFTYTDCSTNGKSCSRGTIEFIVKADSSTSTIDTIESSDDDDIIIKSESLLITKCDRCVDDNSDRIRQIIPNNCNVKRKLPPNQTPSINRDASRWNDDSTLMMASKNVKMANLTPLPYSNSLFSTDSFKYRNQDMEHSSTSASSLVKDVRRSILWEDGDDQVSCLYNDKDYIDIQNPFDNIEDRRHLHCHTDGVNYQRKQRSFSEPEIRDSFGYNDSIGIGTQYSTNGLRNRCSNHLLASGRTENAKMSVQYSIADTRGRAYTADAPMSRQLQSHCTPKVTNSTITSPRSSIFTDEIYEQTLMATSSDVSSASSSSLQFQRNNIHRSYNNSTPHWSNFHTSQRQTTSLASSSYSTAPTIERNSDEQPHDQNAVTSSNDTTDNNQERLARIRWLRINRSFQVIIAIVAVMLTILSFAILLCWIVLTSTFVLAWDKPCDVPLKPYYWLVTIQLLLNIFRSDIMRIVFRWNQTSNQSVPGRVVLYNIFSFIYALLVLRLGIISVITPNDVPKCRISAPNLFNASVAFVTLSMVGWAILLLGFVFPFCIVAVLLTINGYNPNTSNTNATHTGSASSSFPFIPTAYSTSGASPKCIDQLQVVDMKNILNDSNPKECCICMENFHETDIVVQTKCLHMFHKTCCREWLRQSRTCPVCRDDVPTSLEITSSNNIRHGLTPGIPNRPAATVHHPFSTIGYTPQNGQRLSSPTTSISITPSSGRPIVNLFRVLRDARNQLTDGYARTTSTPNPSSTSNDIEAGL